MENIVLLLNRIIQLCSLLWSTIKLQQKCSDFEIILFTVSSKTLYVISAKHLHLYCSPSLLLVLPYPFLLYISIYPSIYLHDFKSFLCFFQPLLLLLSHFIIYSAFLSSLHLHFLSLLILFLMSFYHL